MHHQRQVQQQPTEVSGQGSTTEFGGGHCLQLRRRLLAAAAAQHIRRTMNLEGPATDEATTTGGGHSYRFLVSTEPQQAQSLERFLSGLLLRRPTLFSTEAFLAALASLGAVRESSACAAEGTAAVADACSSTVPSTHQSCRTPLTAHSGAPPAAPRPRASHDTASTCSDDLEGYDDCGIPAVSPQPPHISATSSSAQCLAQCLHRQDSCAPQRQESLSLATAHAGWSLGATSFCEMQRRGSSLYGAHNGPASSFASFGHNDCSFATPAVSHCEAPAPSSYSSGSAVAAACSTTYDPPRSAPSHAPYLSCGAPSAAPEAPQGGVCHRLQRDDTSGSMAMAAVPQLPLFHVTPRHAHMTFLALLSLCQKSVDDVPCGIERLAEAGLCTTVALAAAERAALAVLLLAPDAPFWSAPFSPSALVPLVKELLEIDHHAGIVARYLAAQQPPPTVSAAASSSSQLPSSPSRSRVSPLVARATTSWAELLHCGPLAEAYREHASALAAAEANEDVFAARGGADGNAAHTVAAATPSGPLVAHTQLMATHAQQQRAIRVVAPSWL